jgi:hypothetical protein
LTVKLTNRRQRREQRMKRLVRDAEAHRAAIREGLDYRISGEHGAMTVHTHSLGWHRAKTPNSAVPPQGRGWDRSGPVRVSLQSDGIPPIYRTDD